MTQQAIKLALIRIDGETQSRAFINQDAVADYAEAITEGTKLPAVIVFNDGTDHWLADGFHRYHAHRKIGALEMDAEVHPGKQADAKLFAYGANRNHGLRRTNEDKKKAVNGMLTDFSEWSDSRIAKHVGVDHKTVAAHRTSILGNSQVAPAVRTVKRSGQIYTLSTANIGRKDGPAKPIASIDIPVVPVPTADSPTTSDQLDRDAFEHFDPLAELEIAQKEIVNLTEQVDALSSNDVATELAKEVRTRQGIEVRLAHQMDKVNQQDKDLRRFGKITRALRDLLGVESNAGIVDAVRAALKEKAA